MILVGCLKKKCKLKKGNVFSVLPASFGERLFICSKKKECGRCVAIKGSQVTLIEMRKIS